MGKLLSLWSYNQLNLSELLMLTRPLNLSRFVDGKTALQCVYFWCLSLSRICYAHACERTRKRFNFISCHAHATSKKRDVALAEKSIGVSTIVRLAWRAILPVVIDRFISNTNASVLNVRSAVWSRSISTFSPPIRSSPNVLLYQMVAFAERCQLKRCPSGWISIGIRWKSYRKTTCASN